MRPLRRLGVQEKTQSGRKWNSTASLKELRQQGQFYEYLFVSWGIIELMADESILKAYSLSSQDERAKPLLEFGINKQLILFRSMNVLSKDDYNTVCDFKDKRNNLFHTGGLFVSSITEKEKEELMDVGQKAVDIMTALSNLLGERQATRYVYLKHGDDKKAREQEK